MEDVEQEHVLGRTYCFGGTYSVAPQWAQPIRILPAEPAPAARFVLVPREPSIAMLTGGRQGALVFSPEVGRRVWAAMIQAYEESMASRQLPVASPETARSLSEGGSLNPDDWVVVHI